MHIIATVYLALARPSKKQVASYSKFISTTKLSENSSLHKPFWRKRENRSGKIDNVNRVDQAIDQMQLASESTNFVQVWKWEARR